MIYFVYRSLIRTFAHRNDALAARNAVGRAPHDGFGMSLKEKVLSTMKSRDTESDFELYVTRTPGYLWALLFRRMHVHPIAVTLLSTALGAAAGYFFWSDSLGKNLIGMLLLVWANWYDCADGQLARMTGQKTLIGRILDGFAGDVWFFSIYLFITLRLTPQWGVWIWLLCAWAGFRCHARQCAIADYYRNVHLWFLPDVEGELNTSEAELREYRGLRWRSREWFHKLYLFFYISYTRGQEAQSPMFQRFFRRLTARYGKDVPMELRMRFREKSLPLMKYTNILTFDTRVGVLFLSLILGEPWVYPIFECTVLEALRFYMIRRHETFSQEFDAELTEPGARNQEPAASSLQPGARNLTP